jgi:DeoR family glycerol-3-phosphate regulon repressor
MTKEHATAQFSRRGQGSMSFSFRQNEILDIARSEGKVTVDDLAGRFHVTLQTIRRDLSELAEAGRLERVHGGAILPMGMTNIGYEDRRRLNDVTKSAIARLCASHIPNNSSLFLNLGTTIEAVARELLGHQNLTVVTNNINVANILVANETCEIMVTGGVLRRSDGGLVGDLSAQFVEQFKLDVAIIGSSALDSDGDLLDYDLQEVRVSRAIISRARRSFLVTDSSKLARSAPVRITSLRDIDAIFTDSLPEDMRRICRDFDTEVHLTEAG